MTVLVANSENSYAALDLPIDDRVRIRAERIYTAGKIKRCSEARICSKQLRYSFKFIEEFCRDTRSSAFLIERENLSQILRGFWME